MNWFVALGQLNDSLTMLLYLETMNSNLFTTIDLLIVPPFNSQTYSPYNKIKPLWSKVFRLFWENIFV